MSGQTGAQQGSAFGSLLRELRQAAALTQEELAHRAGLTVDAVSALERGTRRRPYPHTVRSLAAALALSDADRAALQAAVPTRATTADGAAEPTVLNWERASVPAPPTPLVGRESELAQIHDLLARGHARVVSVTGTGGVGKTRLAVEAARRASFPNGTAFVSLAPLADATQVPAALSHALGVRDVPGVDPMESVMAHLRLEDMLLVLDNAEHVLDATAPLVAQAVARCSQLTILVTSRAPLRIRAEVEVAVAPLPAADANELFVQRARAAAPSLTLDDAADDVQEICRRLAGLPLALELAAAKMRTLDPATLLARLDEATAAVGSRDLPERQRSMRAALDWSHRLLDPEGQRALRWLSVFADGFTLESAEALFGQHALALLERLADNSLLVVQRGPGGAVRYGMLEPIRQYAQSLLLETGEEFAAKRAHAAVILALAERAAPSFKNAEQAEWLLRIDREEDDIRAAMTWSLASGDYETAARIGWALWLAWWLRGTWREGREWVEQALAHPLTPFVRNRALLAAASMAYAEGALDEATAHWEEAVEGATVADDTDALPYAVGGIALLSMATGQDERAAEQLRRTVELAQEQDQDWLWSLAKVWLGTVRLVQGASGEAVGLFEEGLTSARARGDRLVIYSALHNLTQVALARGETRTARAWVLESVELSRVTRDRANLAYCLDSLAEIEAREGTHLAAAVLFGAADGLRVALGAWSYLYYMASEEDREGTMGTVREALGQLAFAQAFAEGQAMDVDEALAFATDRA